MARGLETSRKSTCCAWNLMKFGDGQDGTFFDEEVLHHPEGEDA